MQPSYATPTLYVLLRRHRDRRRYANIEPTELNRLCGVVHIVCICYKHTLQTTPARHSASQNEWLLLFIVFCGAALAYANGITCIYGMGKVYFIHAHGDVLRMIYTVHSFVLRIFSMLSCDNATRVDALMMTFFLCLTVPHRVCIVLSSLAAF